MSRRTAFAASILFAAGAAAASDCAGDLAGLRRLAGDATFPVHWVETGMDDGKPLRLVLRERDDQLHLQFEKAREGLWAEGTGRVCVVGGALELRFQPGRLQPGPAAGWFLRQTMQQAARFTLARDVSGELQVRTAGWRGRFSAVTPAP